ncbi:MAG: ParB/RepB/Spo0J family partition protein [Candidatus Sumerlaeia bacterium]|nr:ParB/RepB/Spo0J family partition protein [Candidatus Sumerlaeia bacterium]
MSKKQRLGRGLGALLGTPPVPLDHSDKQSGTSPKGEEQRVVFINTIEILPNPRQPRHRFGEEELQELAESIKNHGVLQPVLVIYDKKQDSYVLLAGERRLRAAQMAGVEKVPALVTKATDEEMLEIAIVENVQRDDLNPVEEAKAYRSLIDQFGWTQEQIAQRVGKKRTTVANALRLLKLNEEALRDLENGLITAGHARAILSIEDAFYRQQLRKDIIKKGLSVREAERRAIACQKAAPVGRGGEKKIKQSAEGLDIVDLQEKLMEHLGCRIKIRSSNGKSGSVEIPFQSPEELERFLDAIGFQYE